MNITLDYEALKRAIQKNPQVVANETKDFLYRANARLMQGINQNPWRVGNGGGGVPLKTSNLKKSHDSKFEPFKLTVEVNENRAGYGKFVHEGTRYMDSRPWLRYAEKKATPQINEDAKRLLKNVTEALGKK